VWDAECRILTDLGEFHPRDTESTVITEEDNHISSWKSFLFLATTFAAPDPEGRRK
jgi:hypothetical protein